MPRSFLVKKRQGLSGARRRRETPEQQHGDGYIPEPCPLPAPVLEPAPESQTREGKTAEEWRTQTPDLGGLQPPGDSLHQYNPSVVPHPTPRAKGRLAHSHGDFLCPVCNKVFPLQRMLTRHLKCHSSVKKHVCCYCTKGFNDTFDLKRHMRTHTGIRPYGCELCEKAFTQRCSLESHLKKIHGVTQQYAYRERRSKIFVCEDCGFTSVSGEEYFLHMRERHPGSPALRRYFRRHGASAASKLGAVLLYPGYYL
ncbi:putative transcription factor ovo-like protein 3 [Acipenser ruthenus]|uniref:putative transcription factor ovo-like protein 3 n=1 Tax=Acipenser ruthenus TaxID=7906 RepID=UPI0027417C79|nr:putative transcription factor ovo-like protein 3 [Acipenser ruthenus]